MVNTNSKTKYIQTAADLSVAFKDNMYFGMNKAEGKRASNQNMLSMQGITGYRHADHSEVKNAAYIAHREQQKTMLNHAWATTALTGGTTLTDLKDKAVNWIEDTSMRVKTYFVECADSIENSIHSGYNSLKSAFDNAVDTSTQAIEDGYNYASTKFDTAMDASSAALENGYAYVTGGLQSGWASTSNFFTELTDDSIEMLRGVSIAGNMMAAPRPAMAYAAPAPRI